MPDLGPLDPGLTAFETALLRDARRDFPQLYDTATPPDIALMDALVLARVAVAMTVIAQREDLPAAVRQGMERTADKLDQTFASLRDRVRACPSFANLAAPERKVIENLLFRVGFPEGSTMGAAILADRRRSEAPKKHA
jgi:hypothetical protein